MTYRGSRKHMLDLLESGAFLKTINSILEYSDVELSEEDKWQPKGYSDPAENELPTFFRIHLPQWKGLPILEKWWLKHKGKKTTWDIISTCKINSHDGLLLVEAKAREDEVDYKGKKKPPISKTKSIQNHKQIERNINMIARSLRKALRINGVRISINNRYQLSNRIAVAWKLAELGEHVALLYLGFYGDKSLSTPLVDADHWQRIMGAYMHSVLPQYLPNKVIESDSGGSMQLIIKALPVLNQSPKEK